MLSKEQINKNTETFKDLVYSLQRVTPEEAENIVNYLQDQTDFFIAPASTKYHGAYEGGLCEHSLHVYENLNKLWSSFKFNISEDDPDSITIVSLFHDLGKVNFYKKEIKHRKVYDNNGNSKWEDYVGYVVKDPSERFMLGNHEENCAYLVSTLLPLRPCEYSAILNHHGGMGWDSSQVNIGEIFEVNPLAQFLHYADCIDAYDSNTRN